ncbi:MAG: peptide-methionine (S)-S-oxide reductase MsrA [Candidatus Eisenbacteria bacterium]|nr:peptide-methionine (S)-S-oxide reductase MsrA [Candidatus Eisenbacteria bacterium]
MSERITLGGGCFWCLEAVFKDLKGVERVESGYAGGQVRNPGYREVCEGTTGHAEVVDVSFDPLVIELTDLLVIFFTLHDPTTLNRQGHDTGTQYRSIILYRDETQRATADRVRKDIEARRLWPDPIVTTIEPLETFYKAEETHQDYYARNSNQPYCQAVIAPKVAKLRKEFYERLKA